jgi:hypothetical protein
VGKVVEVEVEQQLQVHQVVMEVMEGHPVEVEVPEVTEPQQEQVEMEVREEEDKCGYILGNKIFIKIKLWQII